jgi:hypothetical protein
MSWAVKIAMVAGFLGVVLAGKIPAPPWWLMDGAGILLCVIVWFPRLFKKSGKGG